MKITDCQLIICLNQKMVVIPTKAGIHKKASLDSCFRRNDKTHKKKFHIMNLNSIYK